MYKKYIVRLTAEEREISTKRSAGAAAKGSVALRSF